MNRRKYELDMQKRQYERHLHNLEQIEADKKTTKKRIEQNKLLIDSLIEKSHKLHAKSNKHKFRILSLNNKITNQNLQKKYSRIKSVVKTEMFRELPAIPSKQKSTERQFFIEKENMCLFNRLMCAKPSIQFKKQKQKYTKPTTNNSNTNSNINHTAPLLYQNKVQNQKQKQKANIYKSDFTDILNSSIVGKIQKKKTTMKLHKKNNEQCIIINFNQEEMKKVFKSFDRSFILYVQSSNSNGKNSLKTDVLDLYNILNQQYHIFRKKDEEIMIKFYQVYNQKQIYKGHIEIPQNISQLTLKSMQKINIFGTCKNMSEIGININFHKVRAIKKQNRNNKTITQPVQEE